MPIIDNVVFFDGVCNLCNRSVQILIKRDQNKVIRYSSLQGKLAKKILIGENSIKEDSFVYLSNGQIYTQSEAVVQVLIQLGGKYAFLGKGLSFFSFRLLDVFYRLVAINRYKLFGKSETCRLPSPEEASLFID